MHNFWNIPELVFFVLGELELEDLLRINLVSRKLWNAAATLIWRVMRGPVEMDAQDAIELFTSEIQGDVYIDGDEGVSQWDSQVDFATSPDIGQVSMPGCPRIPTRPSDIYMGPAN